MLELAAKVDDTKVSRLAWAKLWLGRFLHPVGVHTWVRWMHYDKASDRVLDMNGEVCQFCPKARLG